jgi:Mn-dependent DtxR family transcriptional regulator
MAQDRAGGGDLPLTQDYLSHMLGVYRPGVTITAHIMQQAGLIRYSRGRITVLDRAGFEATACECYGAVRREFERLLGPNSPG